MTRFAAALFALALVACKHELDDTAAVDDTASDDTASDDTAVDDTAADDTGSDTGTQTGDPGPLGFIGSPCETANDCDFTGGLCLRDGYGGGMCSAQCDHYCDDMDGHPVTFCVDDGDLGGDAADLVPGACHSRCDFHVFDETGCRPGYGCVVEARADEPSTEQYVCMPDRVSDLSQCYFDLAARGVPFEPTLKAPEHPTDYPNLTCSIEDPLYLLPPIEGVDLKAWDDTPTPRILVSCDTAQAIVDTVEDVKPLGVDAIRHIGTYNCRPIAGTSTLSQHAFANAIDIYGFEFTNGDYYTLVDDFEKGTTDPSTDAGQWLYDTAYRWHDDSIWNIILTPNYNADHYNHFHVDMTPGADYIGANGTGPGPAGWIGPMEHDCGGPGFRHEALAP